MGDITPIRAPGPRFSALVPLQALHDVSQFDCGKPPLTDWLRSRAVKSEGRSARTYVICTGNNLVAGYYSIATGSIVHEAVIANLRRNMPNPIPAMILARLAVDNAHQRQGIGSGLLKDALSRILAASKVVGARCVLVHPIDGDAELFYAGFGFLPLPGETRTLFLPVETIARAL